MIRQGTLRFFCKVNFVCFNTRHFVPPSSPPLRHIFCPNKLQKINYAAQTINFSLMKYVIQKKCDLLTALQEGQKIPKELWENLSLFEQINTAHPKKVLLTLKVPRKMMDKVSIKSGMINCWERLTARGPSFVNK